MMMGHISAAVEEHTSKKLKDWMNTAACDSAKNIFCCILGTEDVPAIFALNAGSHCSRF